MQVWCVRPDNEGRDTRIVFDNSDEAIEFAHEALDALFDRLGTEDEENCEILTIEQSKMTRGEWRAIGNAEREKNNE
jgi:hypothetical protein